MGSGVSLVKRLSRSSVLFCYQWTLRRTLLISCLLAPISYHSLGTVETYCAIWSWPGSTGVDLVLATYGDWL